MNAPDVLMYGNQTLLRNLEGFPASEWTTTGVCGIWSAKDVVGHLASFERFTADLLSTFTGGSPTPFMTEFIDQHDQFNDNQVTQRKALSLDQVLAEYKGHHEKVVAHAARIPGEVWRKAGTLPWYGLEYSLDDLIVYQDYGHKREHSAQIAAFIDIIKRRS
jgi:hypothetical protein